MKTIIHVNQHILRRNKKSECNEPAITVKNYKENIYCRRVDIVDSHGTIIATVRQEQQNPLSCGATVWIETQSNNIIIK